MGLSILLVTVAQPARSSVGRALPSRPISVQKVVTESTATQAKAFRPPSNPRRVRGYRTTTGTRQGSCVGNADTAFTVLGPSEMVGLSASVRPDFVWNLPASQESYPVQFRLLAPNAEGIPEPVHTEELSYKAGITKYALPAEVADLSPDIEYRWQVVVVCDENYLSRSLNQELSFEVVPPAPTLQQSLQSATTAAQRALVYGEAGFWYDAIAQVAQSSDSDAQAVLQTLLGDLAAVEADNESLSEDLLEIANSLL